MLYVLEGLPGAGKTSTLNMVGKKDGFSTVEQVIPHHLCSEEAEEYYFYSDYLKYKKAIAAQKKTTVVMDRGYLSTLAYNYACDKLFKSNNYAKIKKRFKQKGNIFFKPSIVLYIAVDVNESLSRKNRINKNSSIWCNKDFLFYMNEFYEIKMPRLNKANKIIHIDGMRPRQQVFNDVKKIVNK